MILATPITPPTDAQRESAWRARLDEAIGLDTEEYLTLLARGIATKRWLLSAARPVVQRSQALVPAGELVIESPKHSRESDPGRSRSPLPLVRLRGLAEPRAARGSDVAA